jgi:hypothetical protein
MLKPTPAAVAIGVDRRGVGSDNSVPPELAYAAESEIEGV